VSDAELFDGVAREVATVVGVGMVTIDRYDRDGASTVVASLNDPAFPVGSRWPLDGPSLGATVLETGRPARVDDYRQLESTSAAAAREWSISSTVGVPIVVEGNLWGVICVGTSSAQPLPGDTEERLAGFTELIATAIAGSEARTKLRTLVSQQVALRRVATLVAEGAPPTVLFSAVAEEVGRLFGVAAITLNRYDGDSCVVLADPQVSGFPIGSRWPLGGDSLARRVLATGQPARIDDYAELPGEIAATMRELGHVAAVGVPIIVGGEVWGILTVGGPSADSVPADTAARLAGFTDLVGTALANTEARDELRTLADEQAALRRVATLVAKGAPPDDLFAAVAREIGQLFDVATVTLDRYDGSESVTLADWGGSGFQPGTRWPLDGDSLAARVLDTGKPARIDDYALVDGTIARATRAGPSNSAVGVPIVVEDRVWGVVCVGVPAPGPVPAGTEARVARFTELVATALSNTEARDSLRTLVDEQAALRRVATLVAKGATAAELFSAVAAEVGSVLGVPGVSLDRYDADGSTTVVAAWGEIPYPVGTRWPLEQGTVARTVLDTARPARVNDYSLVRGASSRTSSRTSIRTRRSSASPSSSTARSGG
jgi:GAF domain-containing protein